jgi:hypothetical protein
MIVYVNGDSHTAAAEATNVHAFAEDDHQYFYLGRAPHPDNLAVSWGHRLAQAVRATLRCEAESASSNARIIRTAREWLPKAVEHQDVLAIIQWSTWEREEWLIGDTYYQVNASGIDHVPESAQQRYKEYVANIDWAQKTVQAHNEIWDFHLELEHLGIPHVFFNGNSDFSKIQKKRDWGTSYIGPYDPKMTFDAQIRAANYQTVSPESWHFGKDAHSFWHSFMLQYIIDNNLI